MKMILTAVLALTLFLPRAALAQDAHPTKDRIVRLAQAGAIVGLSFEDGRTSARNLSGFAVEGGQVRVWEKNFMLGDNPSGVLLTKILTGAVAAWLLDRDAKEHPRRARIIAAAIGGVGLGSRLHNNAVWNDLHRQARALKR
jgi:hypothetical protein